MNIDVAVQLLNSFGGGVVVAGGLAAWVGDLWSKRALQREQAVHQHVLEQFRQKLNFEKSSYDHVLVLILDYYKVFYRHYRLCQRTSSADAWRDPQGLITFTKDEFFHKLDAFLIDWAEHESRVRLLLPTKLLELHGNAIDGFNEVKRAAEAFRNDDATRKEKEDAFAKLEDVKVQMEQGLREFLRVDGLMS